MIPCLALRRVCARVWLTHHCSLKEGVGEGGKGGGRVEGGGVGVERWRLVPRQVERNLSVHFLSTTSAHCTLPIPGAYTRPASCPNVPRPRPCTLYASRNCTTSTCPSQAMPCTPVELVQQVPAPAPAPHSDELYLSLSATACKCNFLLAASVRLPLYFSLHTP